MKYHFDLVCPRCGKSSEHVSTQRMPSPHVNCGDCLMSDVEMKVVNVKVVNVIALLAWLAILAVALLAAKSC